MTDWPLTEDRREELIDGLRKHKDDPIVTDVINLLHRLPRYIAQERSETAVATMGNIVSPNEAMIWIRYIMLIYSALIPNCSGVRYRVSQGSSRNPAAYGSEPTMV